MLGLYIGQVLFRSCGFGRLGPNAYIDKTVVHQIVFSAFVYLLYYIPTWLRDPLSGDDASFWVIAIFAMFLPQTIFNFCITFVAPVLTSKIAQYPITFSEDGDEDSMDIEKDKQR